MCKAPNHHQQTNTQHFTGRMLFLSPNQQLVEGYSVNSVKCDVKVYNFKFCAYSFTSYQAFSAVYGIYSVASKLLSHLVQHHQSSTHSFLTAIFPGEPGLACCPLNSHSPFIPGLHIFWDRPKTFHVDHVTFNTIPPMPPALFRLTFLSNSFNFLQNVY